MNQSVTIIVAVAIAVGVAMQWVATKTRVPALLLLIIAGALLGDTYLGLVKPSALGAGLGPLVTLSVALILFEGALSLRVKDAARAPRAVLRLLTLGALVSITLTSLAAIYLLRLPSPQSLLLGCILVVTGPTVVQPILRRVRVSHTLHSVLQWESILIDPIGAIAAIVVFEILLYSSGRPSPSPVAILASYPARMAVGAAIGLLGGYLLSRVLANPRLAPSKEEDMNNLLALGAMFGLLAAADAVVPESGIVAATAAGIVVANLAPAGLEQLKMFKGQIVAVLIGTLFILFSANIDLQRVFVQGGRTHYFVAALILIVRPVSVLFSTYGTRMTVRERLFAAFFAPRGIVAAAVAILFGAELARAGVAGASTVVSATYETILVTVALSAIAAYPMARALKVSAPARNGLLIVGSHAFSRTLGVCLKRAGVPVMMIDSNSVNCHRARAAGLVAVCGSATDERVLDSLEFHELGTVLALTPNEEVNALVSEWAKQEVGPANSFQARLQETEMLSAATRAGLGGLTAFAPVLPVDAISHAIEQDRATVKILETPQRAREIDDSPLQNLSPGTYLLGWVIRDSFRVYSPESKQEAAKTRVVLEISV